MSRKVPFFSSSTCDIAVMQSEQFLGKTATRTLFSIEHTSGRARITTKLSLVPSEAEVLLPPNSRIDSVLWFFVEDLFEKCLERLRSMSRKVPAREAAAARVTHALVGLPDTLRTARRRGSSSAAARATLQ